MELNTYQKAAHSTAVYYDKHREVMQSPTVLDILYCALGLAGEAGEVANKVKKIIRDDASCITLNRVREIKEELGDCLWYIAEIANILNMDLSTVAASNLYKLKKRQDNGTLKGSGDNR